MFTIAVILSLLLTALILIQAFLACGFIRRLNAPKSAPLSDAEYPKAAVVVCIRGADPTLEECLNAALNQDYPDYRVHIVVDSAADPAWPAIRKVIAANPYACPDVQMLNTPLPTCSLKCSSLIQAISSLDRSFEVVALLDTDVIPHYRWLKDLTEPLAEPGVGATTGNRWFKPHSSSLPGLVRHSWNAAAVVLMYWLEIAWGGSLAIRRSVIEEGDLLFHWSHTFCEDTSINPALNKLGLRLEFVPSGLITDCGDCKLPQFSSWVTRQLLACRLHHSRWWGVLTHGLGTSLVLAIALVALGTGVFWQRWEEIAPLAGALAAYLVTTMGLLAWLDAAVSKAMQPQPSAESRRNWRPGWKLLPAIVLAQLVYFVALVKALSARTVDWRGVRYQLSHDGRLRIMQNLGLCTNGQDQPSRRRPGVAGT